MKRLFIPLAILAIIGGVWWNRDGQNSHPLYSGFIEVEDVALGSKVGGRVIEVFVHEGDAVKAGDVLVQLDRDSLVPKRIEAKASLEEARQRLLELENGSRPEEIEKAASFYEQARQQWLLYKNGPRQEDIHAARANVAAASADWMLASITEKRQRELFSKKDTTADNLDRAQRELSVARNRLQAAEAELTKLDAGFRIEEIQAAQAQMEAASASWTLAKKGPRQEQIAQARAEVERCEAALSRIEIDVGETDILAPTDAVVEVCRLQPGDLLSPNQTALTMILYYPLWVRIYVPESHLGLANEDRRVQLSVNSFPDRTFQGRIVQVNRQGEFTPRNVQTPQTRDDLVFGVKIEIDDPDRLLRPGMVADVSISSVSSE